MPVWLCVWRTCYTRGNNTSLQSLSNLSDHASTYLTSHLPVSPPLIYLFDHSPTYLTNNHLPISPLYYHSDHYLPVSPHTVLYHSALAYTQRWPLSSREYWRHINLDYLSICLSHHSSTCITTRVPVWLFWSQYSNLLITDEDEGEGEGNEDEEDEVCYKVFNLCIN